MLVAFILAIFHCGTCFYEIQGKIWHLKASMLVFWVGAYLQIHMALQPRPEIRSSYIDWVQQSRFNLRKETDFSLRNVVFN